MKWLRRASGVYDSADGRFQLTHICYWELIDTLESKDQGDGLGTFIPRHDDSGEFASKRDAQEYAAKAIA
jgi:hypothetical protein